MRSTMSLKSQKKRKIRKIRRLKIDADVTKILRTVSDQEAFYFYEGIGKPTGESAKSLPDFLRKIDSVKQESLLFHLQRKDFQNWIRNTLGDCKLAKEIAGISSSRSDNLKRRIHITVENRVKELQEASLTLSISENLTVTSPRSTS